MTLEEAIKHLRNDWFMSLGGQLCVDEDKKDAFLEAVGMGIKALRPVSRERVEKVWRGEWIIGEPDVLGVPIHCSRCGWGSDHADQRAWIEYKGHIFCGHCGAPMTDEAVQMVMERLEALHENRD